MSNDKTARQNILSKKLVLPTGFVVIVGCGGSGFNFGMITAMAGVKNFVLIDHDVLEESNTNRLLAKPEDIGRKKVEILKDLILQQGAEQVVTFPEMADTEMLAAIVNSMRVSAIINCVDNFNVINEIWNFCKNYGIRMIRAGSDDDKVSFATKFGFMLDLDGEDGYQVFPNWIGGTMLSAVFAAYLLLYPEIELKVTTISVFDDILNN
jgi:molybdopterin/thiamine biosynthesis adenylyltransferase